MTANRLEITLSDERLARLDAARGHEPRASFVKRALESALSETRGTGLTERAGPGPVSSSEGVGPAASSRASEVEPHAGNAETLATPGCPECGSNMGRTDGRWVCPDCGFAR